jgi:hypothetical protein
LRISDCGLRIADCGFRIADCGFGIADVKMLDDLNDFNALTIRLVDQGTLWGKLKADG